jgi:tetratricopeptide (TPR) repeat protein
LAVLAEAEVSFGGSPILAEEKRWHGSADEPPPSVLAESVTAWPHYAMARALLRSGKLDLAAKEANQAVRIDLRGFWPNFYLGHCAFRQGRYSESAAAFSVCIGSDPNAAGCFLHRASAFSALGLTTPAIGDYAAALRHDPTLTIGTLGQAANLKIIRSNSAPASGIPSR